MISNAKRRSQLRPQGNECPACHGCQWRKDCGGFYSGRLFGNCFEETCCHFTGKDKSECNAVCPYKDDFDVWLKDVHGLRFDDLPTFTQPELNLPLYVPEIDHRSRRNKPLDWPVVSINPYNVLRIRRSNNEYRAIADDPDELRREFLIQPNAKIVLRGISCDPQLERYWENREVADAPNQLARLKVHAAIGPNFSHFLDVPRTDHLYNRRRQLLCDLELLNAGLAIIPHLSAVMPGDWWFWRSFLRKNSSIKVVALEFQTGNKNRTQGQKAIQHLATIQQEIGRPLHPLIVGGAQFVEFVAARFDRLTLLDSTPFFKAMHRQSITCHEGKIGWESRYRLNGQDVDEFLLSNIAGYSKSIEDRASRTRRTANLN